ncbi:MAG: CatB-related O-acetyltransferase [Pseudomonadota bacterium]|nr:CatB-related O-acetyltransferase [Pseudomonadota bacterium]
MHLKRLVRDRGFEIGEFSYGAPRVRFAHSGSRLSIGKYCSFADQVEVFLGGNHRTDWITTYPFAALPNLWQDALKVPDVDVSRGDVTIGHDVWFGAGATVLSGVTIGSGAVIAARAVVTRDIPPYAVAAGVPARVVRLRFSEMVVAQLLEAAWWNLPRDQVRDLVPLLQSNDIEALISAVRRIRLCNA